eukprot:CAMPEP_0173097414 /NCGR_PEP_ID=MMETSP1102-20130122/33870_1 /TAXON_ID=49646 /ORGANISM="Geminigera sp., Strain Caron Lab Isolate" /LENGTH=152 /DNA_ID=CAMNT_0013989213 /DNA_START=281 /DNA_END=743 /DNA_ORIENTATION=+
MDHVNGRGAAVTAESGVAKVLSINRCRSMAAAKRAETTVYQRMAIIMGLMWYAALEIQHGSASEPARVQPLKSTRLIGLPTLREGQLQKTARVEEEGEEKEEEEDEEDEEDEEEEEDEGEEEEEDEGEEEEMWERDDESGYEQDGDGSGCSN